MTPECLDADSFDPDSATMDVQALKVFLDVARLGSFAAAARARNVDPSSISRVVAALEHELQAPLFHRTTRRLALSESGERFFARISSLVPQLDTAVDDARSVVREPAGLFRLTTSVAFGVSRLTPVLPELHARFPGLEFDLVYTDANLDLLSEQIDLAVRLGPVGSESGQRIKLLDTVYGVYASPSYVERCSGSLETPSDLAQHDCLRFRFAPFDSEWRARTSDSSEDIVIPVHGSIQSSNALALREAAVVGLGPALLADWLVSSELLNSKLVRLFPTHQFTATSWNTAAWAILPDHCHMSHKTRAVLAALQRLLSAKPFAESAPVSLV